MTIGEKIQTCRKQLDLSQEELGQKLHISRQTISLWEKDQTVPTIDNLIRLREIFGISVDEILGFDDTEQKDELLPNEAYRCHYSKEELSEIYRLERKSIYKKPIILTVLGVLFILYLIGISTPDIIIGFVCGMFFIAVFLYIKAIRTYNKTRKKNTELICKSTYEYKVFENYICVNIYRDNEKIRESKCFFTDIERIQLLGKWLFFQFGGQSYIIRKSDLKENSAFYSYMYKNPSRITKEQTNNKWRVLSITLFVASLLSIYAAMFLVSAVSDANKLFAENMWLFFLVTPIPIASIVLGFILKSKGYKYKKNIIAGIIMTVLLCIFGSFTFIFADVYNHSVEPIIKAEQTTGIDIPDHKQIHTQNWTKGTQSFSGRHIDLTCDVYFDDSAVEAFEKQLLDDNRWLPSIPNDLIGIASPMNDYELYDYSLIYNVDTNEYNTLPNESGEYHFMNILYNFEENRMEIVEYDVDYVK